MLRCVVCGKEVERSNYRSATLCSWKCFNDRFWQDVRADKSTIVVNGTAYSITEAVDEGPRGFDGRRFYFQNLETSELSTTDSLWLRGTVPEDKRKQFRNSHRAITKAEYEALGGEDV